MRLPRRHVIFASLLGIGLPLSLSSSDAVADPQVRVDGGMTMSRVPSVERNGTGFVVEIKGLANESLAIGGRLDFGFMFGGTVGNDDRELGFAMVIGALIKAEYYLLPGLVRPFVSAGAGIYNVGAQSLEPSPDTGRLEFRDGRFFGVAPQLGVDFGRLRLAATYNMIVGAGLEVTRLDTPMPTTDDLSQNYVSVELSFAFAAPHKPPQRSAVPSQPYPQQPYPQQPYPQQPYPQQPYPQQPYPQQPYPAPGGPPGQQRSPTQSSAPQPPQ